MCVNPLTALSPLGAVASGKAKPMAMISPVAAALVGKKKGKPKPGGPMMGASA